LVETNTGIRASAEQVCEELSEAITPFLRLAGYLVLNLNCPNVPDDHSALFDNPVKLALLLESCSRHRNLPPVFLKITPCISEDHREIDTILTAVDPFTFVKGFILNIPARKPYALHTPIKELNSTCGGLTGPMLRKPTNDAMRNWFSRIDQSRHALIGV